MLFPNFRIKMLQRSKTLDGPRFIKNFKHKFRFASYELGTNVVHISNTFRIKKAVRKLIIILRY